MTQQSNISLPKRLIKYFDEAPEKLKAAIALDKEQYRHALLNFTISFYLIVFTFIIPISLIRTFDTGWHLLNYFHVALLSIMLVLQLTKNRISYIVKARILVGIFFSIGVIANYNLGLSSGNYLYFAMCILLSSTFLTLKSTLFVLLGIIVTQITFMLLTHLGIITFTIAPEIQFTNPHFWSTHIIAFITIIASPIIILGWLNTLLKSSEDALRESNKALEKAQQKLSYLAQTDELTSLPNRRALFSYTRNEFKKYQRQQGSFSVLMLDIDYFKRVNDTYGHEIGDMVLKAVANVLSKQVRDYEIVARTGGEEFVIILLEKDINLSTQVAERIRKAIERIKIPYEDDVIKVTISIGVTQMMNTDTKFENILQRADACLYKAKNSGRNKVAICNA